MAQFGNVKFGLLESSNRSKCRKRPHSSMVDSIEATRLASPNARKRSRRSARPCLMCPSQHGRGLRRLSWPFRAGMAAAREMARNGAVSERIFRTSSRVVLRSPESGHFRRTGKPANLRNANARCSKHNHTAAAQRRSQVRAWLKQRCSSWSQQRSLSRRWKSPPRRSHAGHA